MLYTRHMPSNDLRDAVRSFLQSHRVGALATLSPQGGPHVRSIYYSSDDSFAIYFITLTNTQKVFDIESDARAAFVVSAEEVPQTLQMKGVISNVSDTETETPTIKELLSNLLAKGGRFAPLSRFDPGIAQLYKLTPTHIRWSDFTKGQGTSEVSVAISV